MNTVRDNQDNTDSLYNSEGKRGLKITLDAIRPAAPMIAFDTTTPTEIDPQSFPICACCGVWTVDCEHAS